jgi:hypothetical protein
MAAPPLKVPRELDDFEIGKELGSGHFSRVKMATRKADGLKCAIKIMKKPAPGKKLQFDTEVEIMRKVDHPTIVKLFDVFETDDKVYLVMELCARARARARPDCPGPFLAPATSRLPAAHALLSIRFAPCSARQADGRRALRPHRRRGPLL